MKRKVAWISASIASALCLATSLSLAFAITPEGSVEDLLEEEDETLWSQEVYSGIEHTDGLDSADFVSAYAYDKIVQTFPGIQIKKLVPIEDDATPMAEQSAEQADDEQASQTPEQTSEQPAEDVSVEAIVFEGDGDNQVNLNIASPTTGEEAVQTQQALPHPLQHDAYQNMILVGGNLIPYVDTFQTKTAPADTAGLWLGADSTTDNSWGYFIGHNPGVFTCLVDMKPGSAITVWDSDSKSRTYHIIKSFDVPNTTRWSDVQTKVTGYGESIILQTCIDNGDEYRLFVAN